MRSRALRAVVAVVAGTSLVPGLSALPAQAEVSPPDLPPSAPGRLAFSNANYGSGVRATGLGTIAFDGSDRRVLTDPQPEWAWGGSRGDDTSPQWSPDGTWMAYNQSRPGYEGFTQVAAIPRDGGDPQVLDGNGLMPNWSPDGRFLAWVSRSPGSQSRIAIASVVTTPDTLTVSAPRYLDVIDAPFDAEDPEYIIRPSFSPDGLRIAFQI